MKIRDRYLGARSLLLGFVLSGCGAETEDTAQARRAEPALAREPPRDSTDDLELELEAAAACSPNPLKDLYWGDLHTHTSYSLDAYGFGTRVDPAGALAYARQALAVTIASGSTPTGPTLLIERPLDFAAITDHAEWLSLAYGCTEPSSPYFASPYCVTLRDQGSPGQLALVLRALSAVARPEPEPIPFCEGANAVACAAQARTAWERIQQAADAATVECLFTALPAYEWTSTTLGANLHRNVIFNGRGTPRVPYDAINYPTIQDLWNALDLGCRPATGCAALTIPHNSNLSSGRMFMFDPADIPQMTKYQRLVEIFQHKGSSECLSPVDPADSGYDPQCNFELLPNAASIQDRPGYVRSALSEGLRTWRSRGENPLQLGFVGAVDTHNATPGETREQGFVGHLGDTDDTSAERLSTAFRDFNPGGLTGVWAEANTRDAIFAALVRRETYATSGPRITVRFYQFWGEMDPCADPSFPATVLAAGGIPMGGLMSPRPGERPRFVVLALRDARPIARIDLIKGATSGLARINETIHPLPASAGNRICVVWEDLAYDASRPAYYYARVIEAESERWSTYDCLLDPDAAPTECARCTQDPTSCRRTGSLNHPIQERAWTSPIFHLP